MTPTVNFHRSAPATLRGSTVSHVHFPTPGGRPTEISDPPPGADFRIPPRREGVIFPRGVREPPLPPQSGRPPPRRPLRQSSQSRLLEHNTLAPPREQPRAQYRRQHQPRATGARLCLLLRQGPRLRRRRHSGRRADQRLGGGVGRGGAVTDGRREGQGRALLADKLPWPAHQPRHVPQRPSPARGQRGDHGAAAVEGLGESPHRRAAHPLAPQELRIRRTARRGRRRVLGATHDGSRLRDERPGVKKHNGQVQVALGRYTCVIRNIMII